jgi:hypothetical protein
MAGGTVHARKRPGSALPASVYPLACRRLFGQDGFVLLKFFPEQFYTVGS